MLSTGCASIVVYNRPVLDRGLQDVVAGTTPPPAESLALVQAGMVLDRKHPEWAMTYYRDAALKALPQVESEGVSPKLDVAAAKAAQGIYRRSIEYILETANRRAKAEGVSWTDVLRGRESGFEARSTCMKRRCGKRHCPPASLRSKGFAIGPAEGGSEHPWSCTWIGQSKQDDPRPRPASALADPSVAHFPNLLYRSASAVLRPGAGPNEPPAVLDLHDPVSNPDLRWRPAPGAPACPWLMT